MNKREEFEKLTGKSYFRCSKHQATLSFEACLKRKKLAQKVKLFKDGKYFPESIKELVILEEITRMPSFAVCSRCKRRDLVRRLNHVIVPRG